MSFVSYAQNFEDVMLWRALGHIGQGFYVDVGANDPETDSVTKAFYDRGWRGINIEPVEHWHQRLEQQRPRDVNLQLAAGAEAGEITFYELPQTGLSTALEATAVRHEAEHGFPRIERRVRVESLTSICERLHLAPIHFLKIDVEGGEQAVLEGIDFARLRPWIVVVESTLPLTRTENHLQWEHLLDAGGYRFAYFDGLNRFYVASEHCDALLVHFAVPPNVFDDFALSGLASQPFCRALRSRVEAAEAHATEQSERVGCLSEQLAELKRRSNTAEQHALEQRQRAEAAEQRAMEQRQRADRLDRKARQFEQRAIEEQQQTRAQAEQAEQAKHVAHRWWLEATALEAERDALRSSWSWRVTAPLRWGAGLVIDRGPLTVQAGQALGRASAGAVLQRPLVEAMRIVLRNPALAYRINQHILRHPGLHQRLLRMARHAGVMPGEPARAAPHVSGDAGDYSSLTTRAREIHDRFEAVLRDRQQRQA